MYNTLLYLPGHLKLAYFTSTPIYLKLSYLSELKCLNVTLRYIGFSFYYSRFVYILPYPVFTT